jgi:hypothetical protein
MKLLLWGLVAANLLALTAYGAGWVKAYNRQGAERHERIRQQARDAADIMSEKDYFRYYDLLDQAQKTKRLSDEDVAFLLSIAERGPRVKKPGTESASRIRPAVALKYATLTSVQKERSFSLVVRLLDSRDPDSAIAEKRLGCSLATELADPRLRERLTTLARHPDARLKQRAQTALAKLPG